jgi:hypothetical protein
VRRPTVIRLSGRRGRCHQRHSLYDNLSLNLVRDIAVVGMRRGPLVAVVHPSVPAKTLPEFIAYAEANLSKFAMASAGAGSTNHLAGELFKAMTGLDMTHVPYRGAGPAVADLLGGQVQVMFTGLPLSIEHISGRADCVRWRWRQLCALKHCRIRRGRFRAWLRGKPMVGHWFTQEHAR